MGSNRQLHRVLPLVVSLYAVVAVNLGMARVQTITDSALKNLAAAAEPYIVHIKVGGTFRGETKSRTEEGTGFVPKAKNTARILTAGHVAGHDLDFDDDPSVEGGRLRNVWLTKMTENGPQQLDPVHSVKTNPDWDVAQVFIRGKAEKGLVLSAVRPAEYETLVVMAWTTGLDRPLPVPVQVMPQQLQDNLAIRLNHEFPRSASGSPVLNLKGEVVAILVKVSSAGDLKTSLASPISEFSGWLSTDLLLAQTPSGGVDVAPPPSKSNVTTTEKRSGPQASGAGKDFSAPYTLCNDPLPTGAKIVKHEFFLVGDRTCGSWSECRVTENSPERVCYQFRLQGHDELWFLNRGIKMSEGVLRVTFAN